MTKIVKEVKFLNLQKQYQSLKHEMDKAVLGVIQEAAFIGGPLVKNFEAQFADMIGVPFCVGMANGTDALEIAIESLGLEPGSEVIVPANSFIASSEAVTRSGLKVVFCDCNSDDFTLSIESLKSKITAKTKAVVVVHLYGHPCEMDGVLELANQHGLLIIEDCAQAHLAAYKGKKVGSIGDISAWSFYPGKNLGAYGDAGAITTHSESLAKKCRMIANHGRLEKYNHLFEGRNSRLDGLQAAVLLVKMPHLSQWTLKRQAIAAYYDEQLKSCQGLILPKVQPEVSHVYHLYVVKTEKRDALQQFLKERGIETGVHYPIALTKLEAYKTHELANEDWIANRQDAQLLSLPMGEHLEEDELAWVVQSVKDFYKS